MPAVNTILLICAAIFGIMWVMPMLILELEYWEESSASKWCNDKSSKNRDYTAIGSEIGFKKMLGFTHAVHEIVGLPTNRTVACVRNGDNKIYFVNAACVTDEFASTVISAETLHIACDKLYFEDYGYWPKEVDGIDELGLHVFDNIRPYIELDRCGLFGLDRLLPD
jgi:hypothetical protein